MGVVASTHRPPRPPSPRPALRMVEFPCEQAAVASGGHRSDRRMANRLDAFPRVPFCLPVNKKLLKTHVNQFNSKHFPELKIRKLDKNELIDLYVNLT